MDKDIQAGLAALLKELAATSKLADAIPDAPDLDKAGPIPEQAVKLIALSRKKADETAKATREMAKEFASLKAELESAMKEALAKCKSGADKATKAYMDAIKHTDGLTSAKPSIVKVLQATGKSPDPEAIRAAVVEMGKHRDEMEKKYGKDKTKAKMLAEFNADLDEAVAALGALA